MVRENVSPVKRKVTIDAFPATDDSAPIGDDQVAVGVLIRELVIVVHLGWIAIIPEDNSIHVGVFVMRWRIAIFPVLFVAISLTSCSKPPIPLMPSTPAEVVISQPIVVPKLTRYDEYPGKIDALYTIDIRARVDGYITAIGFRDGDEVKADAQLFEIDPRTYKAQYDLATAQRKSLEAQLKFQEIEVKRNTALVMSGGAASREDLDRSIAKRDELLAGLEESRATIAERKLYLDWTQVRAPQAGKLSRHQVDVGNLVSGNPTNGTLLTKLVSVDPMYVYFEVDERSVQRYRKLVREGKLGTRRADAQHIEEAKLPVYVGLQTEKGYPHVGILDFVDNAVNPSTGTLQVRGVIPNPDRILQPGFFARVQILGGDMENAILISERCIGTRQADRYVYIVNEEGKIETRILELGPMIDGMRVVTSGLKGDEWIISEGLLRVQPGDQPTTKKQDMPTSPEYGKPRPEVPTIIPQPKSVPAESKTK